MITIEEINRFDEALILKGEWDKIIDDARLNISLSFDFVISLWESHLDKKNIILLLAKEEGSLIGIFPLIISKTRLFGILPANKVRLLTDFFTFSNDFICGTKTQESFDAALTYLNKHYSNWHVFEIGHLSDSSNIMDWLVNSRRKIFIKNKLGYIPYLNIGNNWEEYLRSRPRDLRRKLKRTGKELEASGSISLKYFNNSKDVDFVLDKIYEVESESWRMRSGFIIKRNKGSRRFHELYLKKAASQGRLLAVFLCINEEYAASQLAITDNAICYDLKTAHKEKFKKYFPGFILRKYFLKKLFELGFKKFDLGLTTLREKRSILEYKKLWTDDAKIIYGVCLYNNITLYAACIYHLKRIVNFIKSGMAK